MNIIEMHNSFDKKIIDSYTYYTNNSNNYPKKYDYISSSYISFLIFIFLFFLYNMCSSCYIMRRNYLLSNNTSRIINNENNEIDQTDELDEIDEIDEIDENNKNNEIEPPIIDNDSDELISYSELMRQNNKNYL